MDVITVNNENGRIAIEISGPTQGTPVVCVPSMGDLRSEYRFLEPLLSAVGFRVVCMDVRGHGDSSTDWQDYSVAGVGSDILAVIRSLGSRPALVVGTSMAAGAAVWAAAEAPDLVQGMALIGPFVRGENNWQGRLLYGLLFSRPWGPAVWRRYYHSLYPSCKPADFETYKTQLQENLSEPGRLEALQKMLEASKSASEKRLSQVNAPSWVLMGSKDPDFRQPEAEARWLAGRLHTQFEMIDGAGHYPHAEMPDLTAEKIIRFFRSLS